MSKKPTIEWSLRWRGGGNTPLEIAVQFYDNGDYDIKPKSTLMPVKAGEAFDLNEMLAKHDIEKRHWDMSMHIFHGLWNAKFGSGGGGSTPTSIDLLTAVYATTDGYLDIGPTTREHAKNYTLVTKKQQDGTVRYSLAKKSSTSISVPV